MQELIMHWEAATDRRSIFLSCYCMMTENMLAAIERGEFKDPAWVDRLLHDFADYYFAALQAYDDNPASAPRVWRVAHDFTQDEHAWALQELLLGVNAHINYDLVLTLAGLLQPEWGRLSENQRSERHSDYCYVNDIIGGTIDAVQDQVLEPAMPWMDLIDRLLGRGDERLISRLLMGWRDRVWDYSMEMLKAESTDERTRLVQQVEAEALKLARAIMLSDPTTWFD
jgi:hypothetical protein